MLIAAARSPTTTGGARSSTSSGPGPRPRCRTRPCATGCRRSSRLADEPRSAMLDPGDELARPRLEAHRRRSCSPTTPSSWPARPARRTAAAAWRCPGRRQSQPRARTRWRIDVACRDRAGMLARLTGALAERRAEHRRRVVGTWPDGGVLDSFVVAQPRRGRTRATSRGAWSAGSRDGSRDVARRRRGDLRRRCFPWYTLCVIRGPDRPGCWRRSPPRSTTPRSTCTPPASALRRPRRDVESRFEVTDRYGRKLDAGRRQSVLAAFDRRALSARGSNPPETRHNAPETCRDVRRNERFVLSHEAPDSRRRSIPSEVTDALLWMCRWLLKRPSPWSHSAGT